MIIINMMDINKSRTRKDIQDYMCLISSLLSIFIRHSILSENIFWGFP